MAKLKVFDGNDWVEVEIQVDIEFAHKISFSNITIGGTNYSGFIWMISKSPKPISIPSTDSASARLSAFNKLLTDGIFATGTYYNKGSLINASVIYSYTPSTKILSTALSSPANSLDLSSATAIGSMTDSVIIYSPVEATRISTESGGGSYVTYGRFLMSNGSGGVSYRSTTLYEHNIRIYYSTSNFSVTFKFITTSSSAYTYSTLTYALYNNGFTSNSTVCSANGVYGTSTALNMITGVYGYSNNSYKYLYFRYIPLVSYSSSTATINNTVSSESYTYITLTSSFTVQDKVVTLV